ncbi:sensor histidine kinase [Bacillus salipaludis]|uniref:histidine kinase n=1 Tax=Bacillus salipaludis TaxID=2547811 RepID=A0A4R5VI86_9BACI|nr:ATP-binding protein [Bacillus salipaludis]MDQ6600623.1 ATP-binding protein [Bacillus salipaludis]TDK55415.1 sensor histidine kinase [Bacillus salipaludis]
MKGVKNLFFSRSLRYQLLARTLVILAFILLAIGLTQYLVMKDFLFQNEAETLSARLMSLPKDIGLNVDLPDDNEKPHDNGDTFPGPNHKFFFLQDMSLALIKNNGNFQDLLENSSIQAPILSKKEYQNILQDFSTHQDVSYRIETNSKGVEQLIVFKPAGGGFQDQISGILQLGTNTAPLKHVLLQQLLIFSILSALALAGGLGIYLRVLNQTLVPLSRIVKAVKKTNAGNLEERLPVEQGQEEIDRLAESFNDMLARLGKSFEYERETKEQMRRFIADASHELRTPLTSISGFIEVLLRGAANRPEQLYKALNSMQGESRRIIKLVEDLLLLTKLDRAPELQAKESNLSMLIEEMEPQLNVLAGDRAIQFQLAQDVVGFYESDKLKQVILNLFNNAVQHTDPVSGVIKVSLEASNQFAKLSVEDNGTGVSEESLPLIFDRFYRADVSRARRTGGAGLGLSITKSIVEAHGGRIEVESKLGTGTIFIVFLPMG